MRNHRNSHRATVSRVQVTGQFTSETERALLASDRDRVCLRDPVFVANLRGLEQMDSKLTAWNYANLHVTLMQRALMRAGYNLQLSQRMVLA